MRVRRPWMQQQALHLRTTKKASAISPPFDTIYHRQRQARQQQAMKSHANVCETNGAMVLGTRKV
jgi:hypothetical protein